MSIRPVNRALAHLRRTVLVPEGAGLSDGQLLASFVERRDENAFEALLRRHGPMVLGVCRRMLGNDHDAEDAFQATFLVLARKAASVVPREALANWLYGVAHQTAIRARSLAVKRRMREKQVTPMPEPAAPPRDTWPDLARLLDRELSRLPDKYRLPVVLCDLEGKTRKQAAHQLGWPEGSLSGRLSRARALLAKRLTRHGVALSAAGLAALLGQHAASACVPAGVAAATLQAAKLGSAGILSARVALLMEGVLKAMLLAKLKTTALLAAAATFGATILTWSVLAAGSAGVDSPSGQGAQSPGDVPAAKALAQPAPSKPRVITLDSLQGEWRGSRDRIRAVGLHVKGKEALASVLQEIANPLDPTNAPGEERLDAQLLQCVEDPKTGGLDLFVHVRAGDRFGGKAGIFDSPKTLHWGHAQAMDDGTLQLEIFPILRYRPVQGLVLRRVSPAPVSAVNEPDERGTATPSKAVNGLSARIVVRTKLPLESSTLDAALQLTNEGKEPLRLCSWSRVMLDRRERGVVAVYIRTEWGKDNPGHNWIAKNITTLWPGESEKVPIEVNNIPLDIGQLTLSASYAVAPDFGKEFNIWHGKAVAPPVVIPVGKAPPEPVAGKAPAKQLALVAEPHTWEGQPYLKVYLQNPSNIDLEMVARGTLPIPTPYTVTLDGSEAKMHADEAFQLSEGLKQPLLAESKTLLGILTFDDRTRAHFGTHAAIAELGEKGSPMRLPPGKHVVVIGPTTSQVLQFPAGVKPVTVTIEMPGEQQPKGAGAAPRANLIQAQVRGTLRFDGSKGLSAYVSVMQGPQKEETRVWFWMSEGEWKLWRDRMPKLNGKEVVVTGYLAQVPEGTGTALPARALYFEIFDWDRLDASAK
jgi:RNA polymerase sigma factor (sigma-70 family)